MKVPTAIQRLLTPLHTPQGIIGAAFIAIQLIWAVINVASNIDFVSEISPAIWDFTTSPIGVLLSVAIGMALYVWGGYQAKPTIPAVAPRPTRFPGGIYTGEFLVNTQKLGTDFHFEFSVRGFNGTGEPVTTHSIRGAIIVPEKSSGTDQPLTLQPPTLTSDPSKTERIEDIAEFYLAFDQRVPREDALRIAARLDQGLPVTLDLSKLNIAIKPLRVPNAPGRLALWDSVQLQKVENYVRVNRVIVGRTVISSKAEIA